jgi:hypothetical protein
MGMFEKRQDLVASIAQVPLLAAEMIRRQQMGEYIHR